MRRLNAVVGIVLTSVMASRAPSAEPRPGPRDGSGLLRRFDTDGDGKIDEKERRTARKLFANLKRGRGMTDDQAREFLARHSIEAHADSIAIPTLFITSRGDDQVPHALVAPMIEKMKAAGKDVEVYTAEKSPHGFYWARAAGAARALRGEKTPEEAREEEEARRRMIDFFTRHFADSVAEPVDGSTPREGADSADARP